MTLPLAHNAIGYVSETLRSVCCDAPLLMISDFQMDREIIYCGRCCQLIGSPSGDDYFDLYRDRFPRWVKGNRIRQVMESLAANAKVATDGMQVMGHSVDALLYVLGSVHPQIFKGENES